MDIPVEADLVGYCTRLRHPSAKAELSARIGWSITAASQYIDSVCNEAQTGLRLLRWSGLQPTDRVLEVGAGGGLLSGFLQSHGIDLVAIEPTVQGFEATPELAAIINAATGVSANILPMSAHDVELQRYGPFDLIFSVNVLEHFQPLNENLDALSFLMANGGAQVHTCPNYHVPYEPHYGMPLLPFAPHLTPYLARRRLLSENVWRSLNFITARDLRVYAKRCGLSISFKKGMLCDAFDRLCAEPEFAARQPKFLYHVAKAMKVSRLIETLSALPATWVTPMTVVLRRTHHLRRADA
jgi:2-polyprenyl-3-methyl-5-hydroxy-6-metoxy-1,4-benzoquinol methylase